MSGTKNAGRHPEIDDKGGNCTPPTQAQGRKGRRGSHNVAVSVRSGNDYTKAGLMDASSIPGTSVATTLAYNMVIGCLIRNGRQEEAEELVHGMHAVGVKPDAVTFSSLISLSPRAATAPTKAAEWLTLMKELGVQPDVQVRGICLSADGAPMRE